ncbi:Rho GTPase-activating protein 12/27, partial [Paragonimus westermani]
MRVAESQTKRENVSTQPSKVPDTVSSSTDKVSWRRLRDGDQELYVNQRTAEMWAPAVDAHGRTYYYEVNSRNSVWELENLSDCEDADEPSHHTVYDAVCSSTDKDDDKQDESGRLVPSSTTPAVAPSADKPRPKVRNSPRLDVTTKFRLFADASKRSQSFDSVSPTDGDAPASEDPEGSGRFALARIGREHISGPLENKLVNFERRSMVHRTKFMQNDRRLPKRWSDALLLLSGPWLLFYKDAKSALPKANMPYGKPEIKLHVQLVEVSDASGLETSRENVLKFEQTDARGLKDAYLVQLTANVMDGWKAAIRYAKQILDDDDRLTPSLARNTLKHLPNPPSKLDTGLLAKMREFFRSRPSAELLRSRGILKNEPVFASSLVQICENENSEVPRFVVCAIRAIEARGLHHLGIYRISANAATVQKLRCRVNQSDNYSLNSDMWTLDVITGALKLFFRELKEPLFTFDAYPKIVKLFTSNKSDDELLQPMRELIQSMPNPHIATARVLFHHLYRVLEYSEQNQMHSHKLAILFGLSLVRSENDCDHLGTLTSVQAPCVDFCLQHTVELFGPLT